MAAARLVLVAPYLCYMRQDTAFHPGEAISQKVIGQLIASSFDRVITVDAHLHRTARLSDVCPGIEADNLSAMPAIARHLRAGSLDPRTIIVGPDAESRPWVNELSALLGVTCTVARKTRLGDRSVEIALDDPQALKGRPALLVDDIVSSGGTMMSCARAVIAAGATSVDAIVTHALFPPEIDGGLHQVRHPIRSLDDKRAACHECDRARSASVGRLAAGTCRCPKQGDVVVTVILRFCGAARTVTGSCYLFETPRSRVLVDCGLFQGPKTLKALNYGAFPFRPADIDAVLLTHAHIDHCGLLPKLVREGFGGRIFATRGTIDLCSYMLPDAGGIQESEVEALNRRNAARGRARSRRSTPRPTHSLAQARSRRSNMSSGSRSNRASAPDTGTPAIFSVPPPSSLSSWAKAQAGQPLRILASGDIGPDAKLFQTSPEAPTGFDYVISESTYGDRERPAITPQSRRESLAAEVRQAQAADGALLIPAFAVERTQELIVDLVDLMQRGKIPTAPIFLDSPLAIRATEVFRPARVGTRPRYRHCGHPPVSASAFHRDRERKQGDRKAFGLPHHHCRERHVRCRPDPSPSQALALEPRATVLLIGFQARGTLGRFLEDGVKAVRIQGEEIKVAARIRRIDDYSGHADGSELARWIAARRPIRRGLFLIHGEEPAHRRIVRHGLPNGSFPKRRSSCLFSTTFMTSRHRCRPPRCEATAAGLRPRPSFRSIGTTTCRSSSSTSTRRSNAPPMIGPAASSSAGLDGHWKARLEEPVLGLLRLHPIGGLKYFLA